MTAPNTTLASSVTVQTRDDVKHRRDVPVVISHGRHTHVVITAPGLTVDLTLTSGERIALIEALGGKDARS